MEDKEVKFHEEVQKMEYEPLDETEMKLIHWSWGLGGGAVPHQQVRDDHPLDLGLLNT